MSVQCLALLFFVYQFGIGSCIHNGLTIGEFEYIGNEEVFRAYSKDFPYMIEVLQDDQHVCGGVLLKLDVVITSAECFQDIQNKHEVDRYKLIAGNQIKEDLWGPTVQWRQAKKVVKHNIVTYLKNDIALVQLQNPFNITNYVKPIALPTGYESNSFNGEYVMQLGWGVTEEGVDSNVLLKIKGYVPIWRECLNGPFDYWKPHERRVLCIQGLNKGTICHADDGGPTVIINEVDPSKDILVGINLSGYSEPGWNCDDTKPSIVANVAMHLDWINKTITERFNITGTPL